MMSTTHPENSQTDTWEWTDDVLVKQDGTTDSGLRLLAGGSGGGGASYASDDDRDGRDSFHGFRLSVVLRKT